MKNFVEDSNYTIGTAELLELIKEACENITVDSADKQVYCPAKWDTLLCWPPTLAGVTANQSCPTSQLGYDPRKFAFRECWPNGSWYVHPASQKDWSNYTTCIDTEDLQFRRFINQLFVIGYSISLAALIISLIIFFTFRSLKCTRIRIHTHLFVSFTFNNLLWVLWYKEVIPSPEVTRDNPLWCQTLHLMMHYFMVANYMWMFCEALHLHIALVVVFVRDQVALRWFFGIGWGMPLLLIIIYGFVRHYATEDTKFCWMYESYSSWILTFPVFLSLITSLIFLINVLRVILTIMHPNSANPAPTGMRKAVRAALILMPLFGLQHILIPLRPNMHDTYEHLYQYVTVTVVSLQGLCVSCLFCFANQDVHQAVKVYIYRRMHTSRWSYQYTGAMDSAGVYVINGNTQSNNLMML